MTSEIYFTFLSSADPSHCLSNREESRKLYIFIKDFTTLTQLATRLSTIFVDQDNDDVNKLALPLVDGLTCKLLECTTLTMNNRLYEKPNVPRIIQEALIDV